MLFYSMTLLTSNTIQYNTLHSLEAITQHKLLLLFDGVIDWMIQSQKNNQIITAASKHQILIRVLKKLNKLNKLVQQKQDNQDTNCPPKIFASTLAVYSIQYSVFDIYNLIKYIYFANKFGYLHLKNSNSQRISFELTSHEQGLCTLTGHPNKFILILLTQCATIKKGCTHLLVILSNSSQSCQHIEQILKSLLAQTMYFFLIMQ
eukprot:TRINITY_DN240_c1_g1_i3.p3 TRINITY_DN240_c1_g1~~TRINITY_DN240_c1_g1_i3.p3  ORF type:complete len:205 (+),score=-17.14 TRINITY_DN240_c1_g1_i3:149-763(+)